MEFHVRLHMLKAPARAGRYIMAFENDLKEREPWVALYQNKLLWRAWPGATSIEETRVTMTLIYANWPRIRVRVGHPGEEWLHWHVLDLPSLIYVAEGQGYKVPYLRSQKRVELFTRKARNWLPSWPCQHIINL